MGSCFSYANPDSEVEFDIRTNEDPLKHPISDHHHGHDFGERLVLHRHSIVHHLEPQVKILAMFLFIIVCVATPIHLWPAFVAYGVLVLGTIRLAQLPLRIVVSRSLIEVPFVFFAVLMPIFGSGERVEVLGISLSRLGIESGASIVVKGTLGVLCAVCLSATTPAREILRGLERLRLPNLLVQIVSFMIRYVNVVSDEMARMKVARLSRGFEAQGVRSWRFLANVVGALFIRSYERGERVYLAMLSRGYGGKLPDTGHGSAGTRQWSQGLSLPVLALLVLIMANIWIAR